MPRSNFLKILVDGRAGWRVLISMKFRLLLIACGILAWPALAAEYFPLAVGNQWVYRLDGATERVVTTIGQNREVAGQTYFVYAGLDGPSGLLRRNTQGQLLVRQPDGAEGVWADFTADRWETAVAPCPGAATVEARDRRVELGRSSFANGLVIRYACAEGGVVREVFVPGVGLVERETASGGERRVYRLTYARVGGVAVFGGPEHSFRLSLDGASYPPEFVFEARMTLENSTGKPLRLEFGSGQSFDLYLKDARGNRVYVWSATRSFAMLLREETVEGERNWTATDRLRLEPGEYVMEAVLTTLGSQPYRATVPLTVIP
ncbi:MAG: hypothetical protein K7J47_19385 [Acidobacteria bacterium]|jgi:hypothetical protein|nr:hypothetical protein [Bryobacteraceae bacterium CoA2 C42]